MNFANVKGLTIPQGKVTKIELLKDSMRTLLWQAIRYLKGYTIGGNAEVKSSLPKGFKECEYLESHGTEYIDTLYTYKMGHTIEMKVNTLDGVSAPFFGARDVVTHGAVENDNINGWLNNGSNGMLIDYTERYATMIGENTDVDLIFAPSYLSVNGVKVAEGAEKQVDGVLPITLFAMRTGASVTQGKARFYYFRVKDENGAMLLNLVPCLDASGVPCMYDMVSKQTFRNVDLGTFGYQVGGTSTLTRIVGVGDEFAWNQLVDVAEVTNQASESNQHANLTATNLGLQGHKFFWYVDVLDDHTSDVRFTLYQWGSGSGVVPADGGTSNHWLSKGRYYGIWDSGERVVNYFSIWSNTISNDVRSKANIFDLTAIEQAMGITINSLEDFKTYLKAHSMMDKDATEIPYFGYDAGSVKTSLPIVASNQSGSESTTYPLLVSSPLYKWGSVADVAKFGAGVTRKYKKVNLGDLSWTKGTIWQGTHSFFYADITNARHASASYELPTWLLTSAPYSIARSVDNNDNTMDMILTQWEVTGQIRIHNFAFDNATPAEFAEAMKAYDLLYELAEPVTEAVDLPKIVDYQPTILTTDTEVQGDITIEE